MGIASRFSQRWTVVTSRLRYDAISFHESRRSSGGLSGGGTLLDGLPIALSPEWPACREPREPEL